MRDVISGYAGRQLSLHALGLVVTLSGVLVVAPLLPSIIETFDISPATAGVSISVLWATNALVQYPGGRYADHLPSTVVLLLSQVLLVAGFLSLAVSNTFPQFVLGLALVGAGYGTFEPAGMVLLGDLFDEQRGRAFGIRDAAVNLGSTLSAGLAAVVLTFTTWRAAFLPIALLLCVVMAVLHRINRQALTVSTVDLELRKTARRLVRTPQSGVLIAVTALTLFAWQGTASFLPTFLHLEKGFSEFWATIGFAGLFLVGTVTTPVAGALGDRWSHLHVAAATTALSVVGLSTLVATDTRILVVVGLAVFAVGLTTFWPVIYVHIVGQLAGDTVGGDLGALRTAYFALGSLGPSYVGFVATEFDYSVAFASLIGCFLLTGVAVGWLALR
ncbi:MFS transporter [Haloarchaeobius amylolyticus]|uniref:MFS transporter n=1 Tax=Haloarchaeobius amylolyticus TaxID=1198296 RepID=UPI0022707916|nr:MFS transporter [Haloarchaeobius amylolyticus]